MSLEVIEFIHFYEIIELTESTRHWSLDLVSFLFLRVRECASGHDTACYRVSPYTRRRHDLSCFDDNVMMTKRDKNHQCRKTLVGL